MCQTHGLSIHPSYCHHKLLHKLHGCLLSLWCSLSCHYQCKKLLCHPIHTFKHIYIQPSHHQALQTCSDPCQDNPWRPIFCFRAETSGILLGTQEAVLIIHILYQLDHLGPPLSLTTPISMTFSHPRYTLRAPRLLTCGTNGSRIDFESAVHPFLGMW